MPSVTGCNSILAVWLEYRQQTGGDWTRTEADTVGDPITVTVDAPGTYSLRLGVRNDGGRERVVDLADVVVSRTSQSTTSTISTTSPSLTRDVAISTTTSEELGTDNMFA
jgi:hypothetical protein